MGFRSFLKKAATAPLRAATAPIRANKQVISAVKRGGLGAGLKAAVRAPASVIGGDLKASSVGRSGTGPSMAERLVGAQDENEKRSR